ncbi:hypothetical protein [Pseudoflavonifractor sp. 60]|uniref:hypothetical protein n=1 Tax=Pseudoflavonifractor sp. 60 TaxID=2304576 RepID=UPI001371B37F|nr:hypothetical protein [Pseudoflavonifractor sp. 60]
MDNTIYFLYQILKSDYTIPESRKEEALQAFAMGVDFGLSLGRELSQFQEMDTYPDVKSAVDAPTSSSRAAGESST